MRAVLRAVRVLVLVLLACVLFAGAYVGVSGYLLYREALGRAPIEEVVESARSDDSYVRMDDLPDVYLDAVVAIEDHRFYDHSGFDVIAICRAAWHDLVTLSLEQGGSTITQQLAKNLFFTQDKDFSRKVAEVFMALDLEARYTKSEILELYVNTSYFGDGLSGIGEAARGYLGKEPLEMTPWECALMAGLPNAPNALSADPDLAWARAELVMAQMEKYGYDTSVFSACM
ncbi:glycosyl transferase [Olsenella sp. An285]|uniref:biosynthetic peptidoglycan transglycosylase n=1 Tax=Olsenella sp. An285 TaxID=1965621 RepID=UPI000B3787CA|nr:biosynthetic peptidoglycan transglycosylase [Olsenella sp. An285]OUO46460.1 glycosyl transferase [Olsenella sp. An285]